MYVEEETQYKVDPHTIEWIYLFDFCVFNSRVWEEILQIGPFPETETTHCVLDKLQVPKSQIHSSMGNITCSSQLKALALDTRPTGSRLTSQTPTLTLFFPQAAATAAPLSPLLLLCSWIFLQELIVTYMILPI